MNLIYYNHIVRVWRHKFTNHVKRENVIVKIIKYRTLGVEIRDNMLEKQFNPNFVYNGIVHFYIDKKGYSKEKANQVAQAIVKREIQRRICKNESCKHFSYDHIRNGEVCLVADCRCREFTK